MNKKRESHKQALRQLIDYHIGDMRGPLYKEKLVDEILRIHDRFDYNPGLAEALNSGDGSYKP